MQKDLVVMVYHRVMSLVVLLLLASALSIDIKALDLEELLAQSQEHGGLTAERPRSDNCHQKLLGHLQWDTANECNRTAAHYRQQANWSLLSDDQKAQIRFCAVSRFWPSGGDDGAPPPPPQEAGCAGLDPVAITIDADCDAVMRAPDRIIWAELSDSGKALLQSCVWAYMRHVFFCGHATNERIASEQYYMTMQVVCGLTCSFETLDALYDMKPRPQQRAIRNAICAHIARRMDAIAQQGEPDPFGWEAFSAELRQPNSQTIIAF